jgi:predicted nucleic acid-binding protein
VGTLVLPSGGSVYVDANVIIYRIERVAPYLQVAAPLWDALDAGKQQVITSELSVLEVLVKPFQVGDTTLITLFQTVLYGTLGFTCLPIIRQTLEDAARLRAEIGLKTPDAIHAAVALNARCTLFVTNDPIFRRVTGLSVAVLSEITTTP